MNFEEEFIKVIEEIDSCLEEANSTISMISNYIKKNDESIEKYHQKVINVESCEKENFDKARFYANRLTYIFAGVFIGAHLALYKANLSKDAITNMLIGALAILPLNIWSTAVNYTSFQYKIIKQNGGLLKYVENESRIKQLTKDNSNNYKQIINTEIEKELLINLKHYLETTLIDESLSDKELEVFLTSSLKSVTNAKKEILARRPYKHDFIDFD